jgi:hypothetical protein
MTLPYVNSTLTAITAPGTTGDYEVPPVPGADRWTGAVGVYVADELIQVESPGRVDEIIKTRLEIPYDVGKLVERGDTVTYQFEATSHTRVAQDLLHAPLVGRVRVVVADA